MAEKTGSGAGAHGATTKIVNGPVPDDDPSHKLRLEAAKDLVERCKRQLAAAEAELKRVIKESPLKT